ncbi:lytic transglycosylase domain-containing protein [Thalassococcus sp. CAU 1522]|uniref:Lytic transglycosylase domain-containing protein n=1 Tax=Thalassococcus arenae TaxID=2851652 RepID=A0ABS6N7Z7_9RHOB|nr:lytic transglycosylase domain-containing protein [Thalassococcus arenae]MBV2360142.1 lytic transglycosylase domain-containing protein [Thalassococcus arenae]
MSRLLVVLVGLFLPLVAFAQQDGQSLRRAMEAMRAGDWAAAQIEARGDGQEALDVIRWHYLRAGRGDVAEVQDFLARNPDWPGLPYLREKSEAAMSDAPSDAVLAFFENDLPQTGTGALAWARAQIAQGERGAAEAGIVLAWRTLSLGSDERRAFVEQWGDLLKPHHVARLDMALWRGWSSNASAMLPLVDDGWQALAQARMALRQQAAGVDTLIEKVPAALTDHPGLAFERFYWRERKGRVADATALILERSASAEALGEPWAWARARRDLARRLMRDGAVQDAYNVASRHWLVEGSDFHDLEWLSGYLALRHLDRPDLALEHFRTFAASVETPISLGRAGYWLGRAHEAMGESEAAQAAYAEGARWQTSFYGLLAAERAGYGPDPALAGSEAFPDWRGAPFTASSVYRAAILLIAAGENALAERFLTHLAESLDRTQIGQMAQMLGEMGRPHMQVMLGKRAAQYGLELPGPYFALHPGITGREHPVPVELVLAIARRESEFDPSVISGAGARGFMQLMPGTAREVSGWLGLDYDADRLLSDPAYNATLGAAYLADLSATFDGNAVMMAAGYNAGPSRPIRWIEENGDPRIGAIDIVDWIEMIPFDETRNYVMRVTESLPVYRARLGLDPHPVPFSQELTGSTLLARAPQGE